VAPRAVVRNARNLSTAEREAISRGVACASSVRAIARAVGRPASTISRELKRNGGRSAYRAADAETRALREAKRAKVCKLAGARKLVRLVTSRLTQHWSPEQIAGWLKRHNVGNSVMQVSHETIYRSLFVQARGVLKAELLDCLRTQRQVRRPRRAAAAERRGRIVDAVSIRERPATVEDRAVPGHWEGDLLAGDRGSHIATLVERTSRFVLLVKLPNKTSESVVDALIKQMRKLPTELLRSLTWDRGSELAQHKRFTIATDAKVYFCDPQSPWQRGSNENTNGLLRQYFPKGEPLGHYTQAELNKVARELNGRPRETLDFRTPAEVLNLALH
jgi:IS30 family transposase